MRELLATDLTRGLDKFHAGQSDDLRRYIGLSWRLIELKLGYYYPEKVDPAKLSQLIVPDDDYDRMEVEYLGLCRSLGFDNTLVHKGYPGFEDVPGEGMMELDFSRPCVELVLSKWGRE